MSCKENSILEPLIKLEIGKSTVWKATSSSSALRNRSNLSRLGAEPFTVTTLPFVVETSYEIPVIFMSFIFFNSMPLTTVSDMTKASPPVFSINFNCCSNFPAAVMISWSSEETGAFFWTSSLVLMRFLFTEERKYAGKIATEATTIESPEVTQKTTASLK